MVIWHNTNTMKTLRAQMESFEPRSIFHIYWKSLCRW